VINLLKFYQIYQIKSKLTRTHAWNAFHILVKLEGPIHLDWYDLVYFGHEKGEHADILDQLFHRFNQ